MKPKRPKPRDEDAGEYFECCGQRFYEQWARTAHVETHMSLLVRREQAEATVGE